MTGSGNSLFVDANGNVGIGTTVPTAKLDVNGNMQVSGQIQNNALFITSPATDTNTMINTYNGSFLTIEAFNIGNTIKRPITLNAYGGNVGIGITNPSQTLDVYGGISTIVTSILNTSFNIPADTTTRYLYFSGLTTGYNLSVEVTMASYGYGDLVDARFMKFSFVAAIRSNGTGATGTVSSLTSFGAGATNNITIGTPIAGLSYIAVPIVRTTTLYSTYYYTITAICTSVGNNKPKKVEFGL